jgi:integral membrane protein (TIGR00529 family)
LLEIIGLIVAFVGIFILRAKNIEFYVAITVAAIIIGLTSGAPLTIFFDVLIQTLSAYNTWNLVSAVALITVLGYTLKETGLMVRFIEGMSKILPGNILLATIPALFGFLSMPGGALMSAPFIEPEANKLGLKPEYKTYYNVWFRHLLYWVNPITSSTLMAVALSGIPVNEWLRVQSPLFFVMMAIGFIASRDFIETPKKNEGMDGLTMDSMMGGIPILVTVVLTLAGAPIWASLAVGILVGMLLGKVKTDKAVEILKNGIRWDLVLSIISMLYLRDMITTSGSIVKLFEAVIASGIPVMAIAIVVPLFIGAISGSPAMGVGIAFPILLPLFGETNIHLVSIVFLGITCTYITSPLHLCLVLTNNYFKSDLNKVLRYLAPSCLALYLIGLAYHLFLYYF